MKLQRENTLSCWNRAMQIQTKQNCRDAKSQAIAARRNYYVKVGLKNKVFVEKIKRRKK